MRADEKLTEFVELETAIRQNKIDTISRRLSEWRSR